jgi:hypothetical protein
MNRNEFLQGSLALRELRVLIFGIAISFFQNHPADWTGRGFEQIVQTFHRKSKAKRAVMGGFEQKKKTSSIRGGTRSGGQSSWSENHIQRLTLHQLISFKIVK